jgi:hypothetical protein
MPAGINLSLALKNALYFFFKSKVTVLFKGGQSLSRNFILCMLFSVKVANGEEKKSLQKFKGGISETVMELLASTRP